MKKSRGTNRRKPRKSAPKEKNATEGLRVEQNEASPVVEPAIISVAAPASTAKAAAELTRVSWMDFFQQVRAEALRVSWPSRNETIVTTIMVFVMVTLAALFFLLADQLLSFSISWILGFGGGRG